MPKFTKHPIHWRLRSQVAKNLRHRRIEMRLTQRELAEKIGKSQGFVARYELMLSTRSDKQLSLMDFSKICKVLGMCPATLIHEIAVHDVINPIAARELEK